MKTENILNLPVQEKINPFMSKKFLIGLAVLLTLASGIVIGKYFL